MNHLLLTDDPFFTNYTTFGFNVMVVGEDDDPLKIIGSSSASLVLITEGLWDKISGELEDMGKKAFVPIPDRVHKGEIAKGSVERMLSAIVGRL